MMEITQSDAKFLLNTYNPIRGYGMVNKYIDLHVQALSILRGHPASIPSCNCEYGAIARITNSMYEQHEQAIKDAAYPPVVEEPKTTRGRKKSSI